ncbi:MAG: TolC family protein [Chitinophagales bacterium]|nr:TolC family protein [Chitinophagales bacterium]
MNKRSILFTCTLIILLWSESNFSLAQIVQQRPLGEMIQLGFQQSHQLKVTNYQRIADSLSVKEAKLGYTPIISVSGQAALLNEPHFDFSNPEMSNMMKNPKSAFFASGSLTVPVFNGFQLINNLKMQKANQLSGESQAGQDSIQYVIDVVNAYAALYKAEKSEALIQENLKTAQKRVSDFKAMKENGLLNENDLLKAQLQVSKIKLSLLDIQNKHELAQYQLNLLVGEAENTNIETDTTLFNQVFLIENNINEPDILSNRMDYQALINKESVANYALKLQKSVYYPHINLSAMYVDLNVPKTITVTNLFNAGISLSYNISDMYRKSPAISKAKIQLMQLQENEAMLSDQIKLQVHQATLDYDKIKQQLDVYQEAIRQTRANYKDLVEKQANSMATTTDMLDAELELLQARINKHLSQADLFLAYCNYLKVTGNLEKLKKIN